MLVILYVVYNREAGVSLVWLGAAHEIVQIIVPYMVKYGRHSASGSRGQVYLMRCHRCAVCSFLLVQSRHNTPSPPSSITMQ